ncbi:MAG TPA: TIGR03617 family F420-dependent LLM class oxidoreductase, partial [Candidatus Lokiarchaeia archaeon]|nr:TIGR03617 family F420-dependent LLM class oxidoreductase [Candidatus Lokiarchaeia archaeon]
MKLDVNIIMDNFLSAADVVQAVAEVGFDGIWVGETAHDPFAQAALLGYFARQLGLDVEVGTGIAVAFARSPTLLAYSSFDLARLTGGKFILGLGTQVKAHIERRFGMPWANPNQKLRETILAIRAIWTAWQSQTPLDFQGDFFKLNLMSPFFTPPPLDPQIRIPIYIAAVNDQNCVLGGELCEGIHVHPLHTINHIKEYVLPPVERGLELAHRSRADLQLVSSIFIVSGKDDRAIDREARAVKTQIAFYASTPTYRKVFASQGYEDVALQLSQLVRQQRWNEIHALITDDMLS